MVNFSKLRNLTDLNINTTGVSDVNTVVPTMVTAANNTSEGYLGLGIMSAMFILLVYVLFRDDGDIRLDIAKTLLKSSGFTVILGVVMISVNFINSFQHVMWFVIIFIFSTLWAYFLKKKGL